MEAKHQLLLKNRGGQYSLIKNYFYYTEMKMILLLYSRLAVLLLSCCTFTSICHAQLWNRTYIEDRPTMLFSSAEYNAGVNYVVGVTSDITALNFDQIILGKIDGNGDLLNYKIVYDSATKGYSAFYNALIKNDKNELIYAGYSRDSLPRLLVLKTDQSYSSIKVYEYSTPNATAFRAYNIMQYDENSYYITGVITTSNNADVILIKIDSNSNRVWEKSFNQHKIDYGRKILKLTNGNIMIGAVRNRADTQPIEYSNTWLLEVDTAGNLVRQWFDLNDSTYAAEGLLQTQDGGFVYGAQKKFLQSVNDVYKTATIVKLNSSFGKEWIFSDGSYNDVTGIYDIEELSDGSFIGCGNKPFYESDQSILSGWIVKLNSNGGIVWNKTYRGIHESQTLNYLTDIDLLPDGSLIAVGQCQYPGHTPPQVGWFLKLDSNGCEIENCLVGIDEQVSPTSNLQLNIYPNPFTSDVSIALSGGYVTGAIITITNVTGQTFYYQTKSNLATGYTKMLDLSYLPNGVYFVAVSTAEGKAVKRVVKQ